MKLIKIPFGGGGLGKGNKASEAPDKIIEQLKDLYSNEEGIEFKYVADEVKVIPNNVEETNQNIIKKVSELKEKCILLGGDHSITYACFKGYSKNFPNSGLIVFDAHADVENDFSPPSQEDYLRVLIEEGHLDKDKVIIIGLRNWHDNEIKYLEEKKIKYFNMKKLFEMGIKEACDTVMETAMQWENLYLSIDIDAVDPAFAPGTGYNEPGGLTSRQMIYFLQRLKKMRNLRMIDLVEVNPSLDCCNLTAKLAAKLVVELS